MTIVNLAGAHQELTEVSMEHHMGNGRSSWSGLASVPLLDERAETHGDFSNVATIARLLKSVFRKGRNWDRLSHDKQEALDMIASKIGRALSGDSECKDHWLDISGYAELVARTLDD
jgi:hypothetical protein